MPRPPTRRAQTKTKEAVAALPIAGGQLYLHELRSQVFGNTRLVRVWLPPDYDGCGAAHYPILYLNDGQNLFEAATAFAGVHWQVGETATRLISRAKNSAADHRWHRQHEESGPANTFRTDRKIPGS